MKHIPLLASLCGCPVLNAWAQSTVDLAPITIDGESTSEPGLSPINPAAEAAALA